MDDRQRSTKGWRPAGLPVWDEKDQRAPRLPDDSSEVQPILPWNRRDPGSAADAEIGHTHDTHSGLWQKRPIAGSGGLLTPIVWPPIVVCTAAGTTNGRLRKVDDVECGVAAQAGDVALQPRDVAGERHHALAAIDAAAECHGPSSKSGVLAGRVSPDRE